MHKTTDSGVVAKVYRVAEETRLENSSPGRKVCLCFDAPPVSHLMEPQFILGGGALLKWAGMEEYVQGVKSFYLKMMYNNN